MAFDAGLVLGLLIFAAALLYASVGHAGASGYLAAMALFGLAPTVMKPTALTLNILVTVIATSKFYRAGAFSRSLFWPLALASVPFAFIGGLLTLPGHYYKPLVGTVLLYAAWRAFHTANQAESREIAAPPRAVLGLAGAGLGLLSGLTGVGGGIFLSPLLLFNGWAKTRVVSGVAAAFILVNSIAGMLGLLAGDLTLPRELPGWAAAAVLGGYLGAEFGSKRIGSLAIQRLLAVVLVVAGLKMLLVV
jgi:uncharacterized protein